MGTCTNREEERIDNGAEMKVLSIERVFEEEKVPGWREQLTLRAFSVSLLLGVMFSVIVMKLNLTTGIIPSLNVSAGLLGFFFVRMWTKLLERFGALKQPFTRQENTVIQTCVVSCCGIAFSGGFGSYLFAMSETVAQQSTEANDAQNIKDPKLGWMIGFLFVVSFLGLFSLVPLRKVFIAISLILGDGLYNFFKVLSRTISGFATQIKAKRSSIPLSADTAKPLADSGVSFDDQRRIEVFLKDQIPNPVALGGYVAIATVSIITLPHIFHQLKWYHVLITYIIAPVLAFCNAYGCGLTDWSLAATYGKLAIFSIGAWAGAAHGGVLVGLAACGVMMSIVSTASDLTQDFKTGYMTLASPRSMFVSQVIGTAMGCIIAPSVFWLFFKAFKGVGVPGSDYPAPNALVYRNMAILGVDGVSSLPKNCLTLCCIFFVMSILINLLRDLVGKKRARFIPLPMAMAIPFYLGSYFAFDMCIGSMILFVWERIDKAKANSFGPAVASGLICGDGIWTLPQSVLALAQVRPPICMKFLSRNANVKVDEFLAKLS
ncbi:YELLOW STRIPE like 3 [Rhynchospora pubera]|uniref:YELLOW STRIPE like 3 n=1 Tax=Rhynchospora pubera TaxID=906938 RepID=A0AAV8BPX7_9POAL|nr:YELLOW STRIPE like 3 [Rhynchospora pubera]